jgi:hypothetical protein
MITLLVCDGFEVQELTGTKLLAYSPSLGFSSKASLGRLGYFTLSLFEKTRVLDIRPTDSETFASESYEAQRAT